MGVSNAWNETIADVNKTLANMNSAISSANGAAENARNEAEEAGEQADAAAQAASSANDAAATANADKRSYNSYLILVSQALEACHNLPVHRFCQFRMVGTESCGEHLWQYSNISFTCQCRYTLFG